jgi:hypothetical protein
MMRSVKLITVERGVFTWTMLSTGRNSSEYKQAWQTIHELGRDRGLGYLFDEYGMDALVFSPELGLPSGIVSPKATLR